MRETSKRNGARRTEIQRKENIGKGERNREKEERERMQQGERHVQTELKKVIRHLLITVTKLALRIHMTSEPSLGFP